MATESESKPAPAATVPGARLLLTQLSFSGGETVAVDQNAVVVIVGPNNSGKTRALAGIYESVADPAPARTVCKGIFVGTGSKEELAARLSPFHNGSSTDDRYIGPDFNVHKSHLDAWGNKPASLHGLNQFFSVLLDTGSRLGRCGPGPAHVVGSERPQNAFQLLYEDQDLEAKISKIFRDVFGADIVINTRAGSQIPLHVGERPKLAAGENLHSRSYIEKIGKLPRLNDQGDGMRSFGAILLAVKVMPRDIILIDEPEAFLHPPQERRIGRLLAEEQPEACQIVVATHSEDIIQGILSGKADRVTIVRLTRTGDLNHAKHLKNTEVAELWKSPILRYSNVLSGLFHEAVIIAEGDADCRFYDAVASALPARKNHPPDIFYTHSGGKHRMPTLIAALRRLDVPVRAIADVDVLRDDVLLKEFISTFGGDWSAIQADWAATKTAVEERKTWFKAGDLLTRISAILKPLGDEAVVPEKTVKEIEKLGRQTSPWEEIKRNGLPGPLKGEAAKRATALLSQLSAIGLYVVPVGEMEGFAKTVGGHGAVWVEEILGRDLGRDAEVREARDFVSRILTSLDD